METNGTLYKGKHISKQALELIEVGFKGNGCGSGRVSVTLAKVVSLLLGYDFSKDCELHDCEYSISRSSKSIAHKIQSDSYFYINLKNTVADARNANTSKSFKVVDDLRNKLETALPNWYHKLVTLGGDSAYWGH